MRSKSLITSALYVFALAGVATSASAQAMEGFYVRADAAFSIATNPNIRDMDEADHVIVGSGDRGTLKDIGSGWAVGGGAGMAFSPTLRADVTYTYRGGYHVNEPDQAAPPTTFKADLSSHAFMVTGYADFPIGYAGVVPFAGIGLGWDQTKISSFSATGAIHGTVPDGTGNNFAWQATLGAGIPVFEQMKLDLFVRYFDGGRAHTGAGSLTGAEGAIAYSGAGGTLHSYDIGVSLRVPINL
jgi:opacity protein-like surface antigen